MHALHRFAPVVFTWLFIFTCAPAAAAQVSNAALAESLFREGKRLMEERRYSEACPKFLESNRLDPGLGTLLNLALCHESEGKLASAWAEFSEAMAQARRDGDTEREAFAHEHVEALEPRLSKITLQLETGANVPSLKLMLDGKELSTAAVGVAIPIDPGPHEVQASAPGRRTFVQSVQIPQQPDSYTVSIPVLQDQAPTEPAPASPANASSSQPAHPLASADTGRQTSNSNVGLTVSAIATGAFTAGAVVTGLVYNNRKDQFEQANRVPLSADRFSKRDDAKTMGVINLALTGGAIAAAGLTVYFLIAGPPRTEALPPQAAQPHAKVHVLPTLGPQAAGLSLIGSL